MLTGGDTMKKGKGRIVNARFAGWLSRLPALVRPFTAFGGRQAKCLASHQTQMGTFCTQASCHCMNKRARHSLTLAAWLSC